MKHKVKSILFSLLMLLFVFLVIYLFLALYYKERFFLNTWINGVYCTGKTVEQVNQELMTVGTAPVIKVIGNDGEGFVLDLAEMGYEADYSSVLEQYIDEQNLFLWIENACLHKKHEIVPEHSYDTKKLRESFQSSGYMKEQRKYSNVYEIRYCPSKGYFLVDGLTKCIDVDTAFEKLCQTIQEGNVELNLGLAGCYYEIELTAEQRETKELWDTINEFCHCSLLYDLEGTIVPMDVAVMSRFIKSVDGIPVLDNQGKLVLDEKEVIAFVETLAQTYDSRGKERQFQSTRGEVITVKGGTYGSVMNQEEEVKFLMENLLSSQYHGDKVILHEPSYISKIWGDGENDIGNTYIEVDMTEQKLYFYKDGIMKLETYVVTGNLKTKHGTPQGVNYVYIKQKNRILRGPGYASPVKYWMPVVGDVGIHDASWRRKFGGSIYKTNGSHGCINVPSTVMPELYEMAELGTPVVMFY